MSDREQMTNQNKYQSLKNSPKIEETVRECEHHKKILQLRSKIKMLQQEEARLRRKNDQIIQGIEQSSEREKRQQEQKEIWKKKYQALKAQNQHRALKLANSATNSILSLRNANRQKYSARQPRTQIKRSINVQQLLTREQKQYVKQLQFSKRQRSASLKVINSGRVQGGHKYSTVLPDGLVIHIIDGRNKGARV